MHPTEIKDEPGTCDICGMDLVPAESLGVAADPTSAEPPLVIPRSAVLFTGTRSLVYVQTSVAEGTAYEPREVVLGPRAGEVYVVREGLREGERVVTNGAFRVDSAMQIAAKPSMMSPEGGAPVEGHAGMSMQTSEPQANPEPAFQLDPALDPALSTGPDPQRSLPVPEGFVARLDPVYSAYFEAQTALAGDDLNGFNRAATALRAAIASVEIGSLDGAALDAWRRASADLRTEREFEDIEAARARFERMSAAAVALEQSFGHAGDETWHLANCPMAFDFAGADWLQRGTEINNPYFGASMLRCGDVTASFDPADGAHEGHDHD